MKKIIIAAALMILLTSCAAKDASLPDPADLYAAIESAVELPEMIDVTGEYLEPTIGVEAIEYDSAVYYIPPVGVTPDEIVIVKAKDTAAAKIIQEKFETRLAYKAKSAENYLTEYLPIINDGVIRRDGLIVSLIVTDKAAQIVEIFNNY
ncbi:MAG: DUF4358 domain-containing protein [Oscillospiraceae bacterium]|jgi:hypothetical protein|nr:DUF4358 domain-containing protein [Oscillospiraceae bacterium]